MSEVEEEVAFKKSSGCRQVSLAEMSAELGRLGYRLDRGSDCSSRNRYMDGPRAGCGYPAVNMRVVQISDGKGFANIEARRDANFDALQALRSEIFAVSRGVVYEI